MPPREQLRDDDLVLAPNEFIAILESATGRANVMVGPMASSLGQQEQPVLFNPGSKVFDRVNAVTAVQTFPFADEGAYMVLHNPSKKGDSPEIGKKTQLAELNYGQKVNVPGPTTNPLWPGQIAKVIPGHQLRSNQYLLVKVYNSQQAEANWGEGVVEGKLKKPATLENGQLLVIKGTEVSFYIPPTGIEVLQDEQGEYTREAVTLERLEYCILLDEDGNKRFVRGAEVEVVACIFWQTLYG